MGEKNSIIGQFLIIELFFVNISVSPIVGILKIDVTKCK